MSTFWYYVKSWFFGILQWTYNNILSIQVGGISIGGWLLGLVIVVFVFRFLLRLRPDEGFGRINLRNSRVSVRDSVCSGSVSSGSYNRSGLTPYPLEDSANGKIRMR